jgi:hypothetical protein
LLARETGRCVVEVFESKHPCSLHIDTIRKTATAPAHRSRLPRRCVRLPRLSATAHGQRIMIASDANDP